MSCIHVYLCCVAVDFIVCSCRWSSCMINEDNKDFWFWFCYYHNQIGSINLTHCYHIFRGCVPAMFVAPSRKTGSLFHYNCAVHDDLEELDMFCLADRIRLFVHNSISLSSLCKLFWRQWTDKMPVRYILSRVWVRLSIFSQLSIIQYMGLCVFSLPFSLVMIGRIYTLSYYHNQMGSMNCYR